MSKVITRRRSMCLAIATVFLMKPHQPVTADYSESQIYEYTIAPKKLVYPTTPSMELARAIFKEQSIRDEHLVGTFLSGKLNAGRRIYKTRCVLCHGENGLGDGLMSKVITDPPPSDLTKSTIDKLDVMSIIVNGGATMDRSPQMPPWGDEIADGQLESLIDYLMSLRKPGS